MRLRIRTLLLTVALLCSMTSTVSACIYIPILEPFYWLFGCGSCHGGYGYANCGPNPYGVSRCIDDWLGYGYLRNQQGTLGHYPGRPISCYQPVFPHLLNPCSWFAHCPLFAPCGPSCGMTAPMVAPLAPPMMAPCQMPYQAQWQNQPMPGLMNPWGGNCNDPCGSQCMPQPMMQYQPAPAPLSTWQPMPVYRGHLLPRRAWYPRHRAMMVPQAQYVMSAPTMQMPMMPYPAMDPCCYADGCDDCGSDFASDCGCGGDPGSMMPGYESMQGTSFPDMNTGSGCCGSDNGIPQSGLESGMPPMPQSSMMMSPGSMSMSRMSMGQPHNLAPYTSMSRWYSNRSYPTAGQNPSYRQSMAARHAYATTMYRQPQSGYRSYTAAMRPVPQSSGWQTVQMMPQQFRPMPSRQMTSQQMTVHRMPSQGMPSQRVMSPLIGGTMPGSIYVRPMVAGDINGDHEWTGPSSAAVPIVQNSFNGRSPIQQASWSQPVRTPTTRRYQNSVQ